MFTTAIALVTSFFAKGFLQAVIDVAKTVLQTAIDFIAWYVKQFWSGLGVIFTNLSVLSVILVVFISGGYYFKTWDNDRVLQQCIKTCPAPKEPQKYYHPIKKKIYEKVSPGKLVYQKPQPKPKESWNPFNGN